MYFFGAYGIIKAQRKKVRTMKHFADNIRFIRKANKLTQKEMAAKLGKAPIGAPL